MEKFSDIWSTLEEYNLYREATVPEIPAMNNREWVALMGRYGTSHIRFNNRGQFMAYFMTIVGESQEKLRAKLKINTRLREMEEEEAMIGDELVINQATNPDTDPPTDNYEPLPFVNAQNRQRENLSKVSGLYNWKHSVGGQAFNEYLDSFRVLFRNIMKEEIWVYEQ